MAQQQFDISKRLIAMVKNETRAKQQMRSLVKQTSKYYNNVATFKEAIDQHQRNLENIHGLVIKRREDLNTRIALNEVVQDKVSNAKQRLEYLQEDLVKTKQEHNQLRGSVRTLCDATNTYINTKEFPTRMKGVSISRTEDHAVTFNVATSDLKGLGTIWKRLQIPSSNANKWGNLISTVNPHSNQESNNVSASSIIEIDLTSPPSHK